MVSPRRRETHIIVVLGAIAIIALGIFAWRNAVISASPESLLLRLPTQDAVVAGIDFIALRRSGFVDFLLDSKTPQDADYTAFVQDTGFDYRRDLEYVLASFAPDGEFFLVKGKFDWPKLEEYVAHQKGSCFDHLCRVSGSTPEKKISFFPLRNGLMAMAVSTDDTAATRLNKPGPQGDIAIPGQPVWISMSAGALRHSTSLPGSSKIFASAITDANRITITLGLDGNALDAHLDAVCRDAQQAGALTTQLRSLTNALQKVAQQGGKPIAENELSGLLAAGKFDQAGSHVMGTWPVSRALLQNLRSGM
jgi:hypothetical protein